MTFEQSCISYIDAVKSLFERYDFDAKFYVAGGSVFAAYTGNMEYSDIDVYFYNSADLERFENSVKERGKKTIPDDVLKIDIHHLEYSYSPNAINFYEPVCPIQVIKLHTGEPTDIFKTYDINCSQIAYTSDHETVMGEHFSTDIVCFLDKLTASTISRYNKYTKNKGANDTNGATIRSVIDEIFKRPLDKLNVTYEDATEWPICYLLNNKFDDKYKPYIQEKLSNLNGHTKIKMFKIVNTDDVIYDCVEKYVHLIDTGRPAHNEMRMEYDKIAKVLYPEYFI